ncbi:MAG TPA: DUF3025 domain-containing protein [Burkholderiales bacterium]|nr:DUF3025 domain-containing protein [Burkholderiales bacterium]
MRPWLGTERTLAALNRAAAARELRTESGKPIRFVTPGGRRRAYELRVHETGEIETRAGKLHDWFNALCWLAFPRTKARINAMHAAEIPREAGQRGRLRDLLTIFDEGGAIVLCAEDELNRLVREFQWKALFWDKRERVLRSMRFVVLGHAVLEQALKPWPGITCKALFARPDEDADRAAAAWLASRGQGASPRDLAPLPVFGYPGWADNHRPQFYDDERYFRDTKRGGAA